MLGVDPDTLRRWADEGRVEAFTTPGGHRRFDRRELERLLAPAIPALGTPVPLASLGATPGPHVEGLPAELRRPAPMTTSARPSRTTRREAFRTDGRGLVASLVAYLDADDDAGRAEAEARAAA